MHALWRQIRANLRDRKAQRALLFLVLAAAALLLTLGLAAYTSGFHLYDRLMTATQGAHIWLHFSPEKARVDEVLARVREHPEVTAVSPPMPGMYMTLLAPTGKKTTVLVRDLVPDAPVNRLLLVEGREPQARSDEIYLDANLARELGIRVGDTVQLASGQRLSRLQVVGTFITSETCAYPNCNPPVVYLGPETLSRALEGQGASPEGWYLAVRIRHPQQAQAVLKEILAAFPPGTVSGSTWLRIREVVGFDTRIQAVLMLAFAVMAGLLAGFLTGNHVAAAIRLQARRIGLLRAVGFTNGQIAGIYLGENLLLALVAGLAGEAVGLLTAARLLAGLSQRYAAGPVLPSAGMLTAALLALLLVVGLATAWPLRSLGRMDTVTVLRMGMLPPRRRRVRLLRLPFPLAHGLADLLAVPSRTLLTFAGMVVVTVAMMVAMAMVTTVQAAVEDPARLGLVPPADVALRAASKDQAQQLARVLQEDPRVVRFAWESRPPVRLPGETEDMYPRFIGGDVDLFSAMLIEGQVPQRTDEVAVTYTLARKHGWRIGDTIRVFVPGTGKTYSLRIVGLYRDSDNLGRMMLLPGGLLGVDFGFTYWVQLQPGADPRAFIAGLQQRLGTTLRGQVVKETFRTSEGPDVGAMLNATVTALSALLAGMAGLGLFAGLSLNVYEERRTFAILKALGMTPGQVRLALVSGAVVLAVAAYLPGVPLGVWATRRLFAFLGMWVGLGPIWVPIPPLRLVAPAGALVAVAVLAALLPARRAARLPVVEVLREAS